jgi:hypothetical protein
MRSPSRPLCLALLAAVWGCLEDPTPDSIRLRFSGPAGQQVTVITSTNFIAGQSESGATSVQVFGSDTIVTGFPFDTTVSILPDRRFFTQLRPFADTLLIDVRIDADARSLFDDQGNIFANDPWNFVYLFNTQVATTNVDVVF